MNIGHLLSIDNVFFTFLGYPMSYIEFFGTLLNIASVWLIAKKKVLSWPVGNIAVFLFMILFFQIQLYSDFIEQIYFLITGFYGWWLWSKGTKKEDDNSDLVYSDKQERIKYVGIIAVGSLLMGYFISNIHLLFPTVFTIPASFPYLDAFTTVLSFTATILMIHKRIDSWVLWILVDIIGIGLYYVKDVKFISLLYVIFLVLATKGLLNWRSLCTQKSTKSHEVL